MNHSSRSLTMTIAASLLTLALGACNNDRPIEGVEEFGKINGGDHTSHLRLPQFTHAVVHWFLDHPKKPLPEAPALPAKGKKK